MRGNFGGNDFNLPSLNKISFEQGVTRAKNVIKKEEVPFEKFESFFGSENIHADKAYVANRKEKFEKNKIDEYGSNCATILEAITHMRFKKGDWIDGLQAIKTNEFDDIAHGIDEVLRVINPETKEEMTLAIDILSVGGGPLNEGIEKKMERIHNDIVSDHLPEVKYFLDEETGKVGIKDIPRIIIAADVKTVQELNELWMEKNMEKLAKHPLRIQILEKFIEQGNVFGSFARRNERIEIAKKYDAIRLWAKEKLKEKIGVNQQYWNDNASFTISNALYRFKEPNKQVRASK
ncbi:MAG: hypothetical protein WC842_01120 [Candidatus Paceibacterota bacterium]|jgi:hypothetical protein